SAAKLLPKLKDAAYDAEDLLDEFRWYNMKVSVEGDAVEQSPIVEFQRSIIQGSFNKVADTQKRLFTLSSQLKNMGLHQATPRFDKSLRPVTTRLRTEPMVNSRSSKRRRSSNEATNEPGMPYVPVLPIFGIGGIGKTTLAQEITTFQRERFTKVLIKSLSGKEATENNLDDLQQNLVEEVGKKRFLLILDDIWPDPSKKDENRWRKFSAPLTNAIQGSMLLVATRFAEVAEIVGTMEPFALEGLKDEVFWKIFKLCLEQIGRSILLKLKVSPLAAKTIGRLLRKSLNTAHWNDILNNEVWQIEQKVSDILPALRDASHFALYTPKDYNFEKATLAEIWVAKGFVEPQGNIPLQHIGDHYFEDLSLSFFQKLRGKYVIHDLLHDMAQLVSKDECFIVKYTSEIKKVPLNIRHLLIQPSCDLKSFNTLSLGKHTKLRTLLCNKSLKSESLSSVTDCCFNKLQNLRVIFLCFPPESIGNLKNLRYFEISRKCLFKGFPPSFCSLYNLQILYARKCEFQKQPEGISKLINLQKLEAHFPKRMEVDAEEWGGQTRFINNFNPSVEELAIYNLGKISTDHAAELGLSSKKYLNNVTLRWSLSSPEHNQMEVLRALRPSTSIKCVHLMGYPGQSLPNWLSFPELSTVMVNKNNGRVGTIFSSLKYLSIEQCESLSSLELFLQPAYVPSIRRILIAGCKSLKSLTIEQFEDSASLEELKVHSCPNITLLLAPSIKTLKLKNSGNLSESMECRSLTVLHISRSDVASIKLQKWSLPALRYLNISDCEFLTSVGGSEQISNKLSLGFTSSSTAKFRSLSRLTIEFCDKLETLDGILRHEYIPIIEIIEITGCGSLPLSTKVFRNFAFLKSLTISTCPSLNWQSGTVLPSSLKKLTLRSCGDLSTCFPSCLEKLISLEYLVMVSCEGIVSIPPDLWSSNLKALQELWI
ncbi:hypothetical protein BS78_04G121500, partial [Paspalum vaginatum]